MRDAAEDLHETPLLVVSHIVTEVSRIVTEVSRIVGVRDAAENHHVWKDEEPARRVAGGPQIQKEPGAMEYGCSGVMVHMYVGIHVGWRVGLRSRKSLAQWSECL